MMIKASALCLLSALIVQSVSFVCSCSLLSLARPVVFVQEQSGCGRDFAVFRGCGQLLLLVFVVVGDV